MGTTAVAPSEDAVDDCFGVSFGTSLNRSSAATVPVPSTCAKKVKCEILTTLAKF